MYQFIIFAVLFVAALMGYGSEHGLPILLGVVTTGSFARDLYPGVKTHFNTKYKSFGEQYKMLFDTEKSSKAYELSVGFVGTGLAPRKVEGGAISYQDIEQGWEAKVVHAVYSMGIIITREENDDNLSADLSKKKSGALAFSMNQTKEIIAANVYNRAFSGSYLGADGVSLLSASHQFKPGGTFSNQLAVAADLSETTLEQACIDIAAFKDEAGLQVKVLPRSLIIPVRLQFEAHRILKSVNQNDTANNAVNALRDMGMFPDGIKVNNFLTDTNAWFIRTNCPDGMVHYQRDPMEIKVDNDFDTDNAKYKARERYSFAWLDPRGLYGSAGA